MFTTTNVAANATSAGVGGPVTAVVPPTFQIISTPITGSSSSTSSTTAPAWRITSTPSSSSSLIKQPSIVSIRNGNINLSSSTSSQINSTGVTIPNNTVYYIATASSQQHNPLTTGNIIIQSPQTVRFVATPIQSTLSTPTITRLSNSNTTILNNSRQILTTPNSSSSNSKLGICINTSSLGQLAPTIQQQLSANSFIQQSQLRNITIENQKTNEDDKQINSTDSCIVSNDDHSLLNNSQDEEIEIFVSNVVCSFSLCCELKLREIAKKGANVVYKREQAMVLMKIRKPNCTASIWSSGKVTVTGTTSDDDALRAARRIARSIQRLGNKKAKFRHYRIVNCLASCIMPWTIDIVKLSQTYPDFVSYEPEIHPGATVRLPDKAVLKVFTTGSVTITAPSVERINTAVNEIYPKLFECKKLNRDQGR